jgi:hypothetical protein
MKRMNHMKTFVAGLAVALLSAWAFATTMVPVNLAEIVENTEKAFVCVVQATEIVETPNGWAEKVTVQVTDPVLGKVRAGESVSWLQFRNGKDVRLSGMPSYQPGEEHMIFLSGKGRGTDFQAPFALGQGSFRVHTETATGEKFARNEFANAHLFEGLDADLVAQAIVDEENSQQGLDAAGKARRVQARKASLAGLRAGAQRLDDLKAAARAMKAKGNPSAALKGAAGAGKKPLQSVKVP